MTESLQFCQRCCRWTPVECECFILDQAKRHRDIEFSRDALCWTYWCRGEEFRIYLTPDGSFIVDWRDDAKHDTLLGAMAQCRNTLVTEKRNARQRSTAEVEESSRTHVGATGAYPV